MGDERRRYLSNSFILLLLLNLPRSSLSAYTRELLCSLSIFPSGLNIPWQSKDQKEEYIQNGFYVPKNIMTTRFQFFNNSAYFAIPRFRCGVPFTIGMVFMNDYCKAEPLLYPYPNWESNRQGQGCALNNVVDVVVDSKKILWALDVGIINTLTEPKYVESPRVVGICLKTGRVSRVINLSSLVNTQSRFQYIQVEVAPRGNTYVYVSDAGSNAIIVWDVMQDHGFKVVLPKNVQEGGCNVKNDVLYIVLLVGKCARTNLFFTYLNAKKMYHISTALLRSGKTQGIVEEDGPKPGRMVLLGSDEGNNMFFRLRGKSDIFHWDSSTDFRAPNFLLAQPIDSGRFPTHVSGGYRGLVFTLESNFPDYLADRINDMGASVKLHPTIRYCDETVKERR